jgi:hypothetical protein
MYKCEICGRESKKKIRLGGYTLCSKHMHQLHDRGKFLDNIQRTNSDLNDYKIEGEIIRFNLYNQKNEYVGNFIIDFEDIEKVKYHKWRFSHSHVVTGQPAKGEQKELSHIVLDVVGKLAPGQVVDHINGDATDNRKENLRICTQSKNTLNKSFISNNTSGFIGVSYSEKRDRYDPEIRIGHKRCHLGYKRTLEEAVYARYIAEKLVFKEFANEVEQKKKWDFCESLSDSKKKEVEKITIAKLKDKGLWQ